VNGYNSNVDRTAEMRIGQDRLCLVQYSAAIIIIS